jgi:hypothetical protein
VKARVSVFFEQDHVLAFVGQQRGNSGAARPAANDKDIAEILLRQEMLAD